MRVTYLNRSMHASGGGTSKKEKALQQLKQLGVTVDGLTFTFDAKLKVEKGVKKDEMDKLIFQEARLFKNKVTLNPDYLYFFKIATKENSDKPNFIGITIDGNSQITKITVMTELSKKSTPKYLGRRRANNIGRAGELSFPKLILPDN